jgi:hypothetical protein
LRIEIGGYMMEDGEKRIWDCRSKIEEIICCFNMGHFMDIDEDKRGANRDIESVGRKAFIHWNGPPLNLLENLGRKTPERYFNNNS